jgi:hypothetical protein
MVSEQILWQMVIMNITLAKIVVSFGTLKQKFAAVVNKILCVCLSICQGVTTWEMLNGFSWTVVWEGSTAVYRHTLILVKIEQ